MKANGQLKSVAISNTRWLAYATAGTASAIVGAPCADAEIHYSGKVDAVIDAERQQDDYVQLPLSNRASLVFDLFSSGGHSFYSSAFFLIKGKEIVSAAARAYQTDVRTQLLSNVQSGSLISNGKFGSIAGNPGLGELKGVYGTGQFFNSGKGIIGFKFDNGFGTQYGWVRIKVSRTKDFKYRYRVEDYAWGDVGDPISAGQKRSIDSPIAKIFKSGSLGLLAFGSMGLDAWRGARPASDR